MASRGPQPLNILAKAAAVENIVTWIIASRLCPDPAAFGLFMEYAADRIPVDEKTRLLAKIVADLPEGSGVYGGLADDLRVINDVRRFVAHAIYVYPGVDDLGPHYVMFKKGKPKRILDRELRTQAADALKRIKRVAPELAKINEALGTPFKPVGFIGKGADAPGGVVDGEAVPSLTVDDPSPIRR
ncbi:hypothetical protein GCM10027053_46470 [Intrasporangium mesophilum]